VMARVGRRDGCGNSNFDFVCEVGCGDF